MSKPGVMIYFEIRPNLDILNDHQNSVLFKAILDYGKTGEANLSEFDSMIQLVWNSIQPRIDADNLKYQSTVQARSEAGKAAHKNKAEQMPTNADICQQNQLTKLNKTDLNKTDLNKTGLQDPLLEGLTPEEIEKYSRSWLDR